MSRGRVSSCLCRRGWRAYRPRVEERPLDDDLPSGEESRPFALPGLASHGPDAVAAVGADLLSVPGVVERVPKVRRSPAESPFFPVSVTASVVARSTTVKVAATLVAFPPAVATITPIASRPSTTTLA